MLHGTMFHATMLHGICQTSELVTSAIVLVGTPSLSVLGDNTANTANDITLFLLIDLHLDGYNFSSVDEVQYV